jgi:foldase protein PrsA
VKILKERGYILLIFILALAIVLTVSILSSNKEVVASVGGNSINKEDLYDVMVKQYGSSALEVLIINKIVELEVGKENITVTNEEIEEELGLLIESYGGEDLFTSALESNGMTMTEVKDEVKTYLQTNKLLEPRITITEEELETYFEENKDLYATQEQVKASHILVADESTAKEVSEKMEAGQSFAELAKEYSTDPASAESGGDLGYFERGVMAEEFEEVAFSLNIDSVSNPVQTEFGYHIIKVTDKTEAKEATFEESKEEIRDTLFDEKLATEYTAWLEEKKAEYQIESFLE